MLKHLIFMYDGIWYTYGMDLYVGHTALRKTLCFCVSYCLMPKHVDNRFASRSHSGSMSLFLVLLVSSPFLQQYLSEFQSWSELVDMFQPIIQISSMPLHTNNRSCLQRRTRVTQELKKKNMAKGFCTDAQSNTKT